MLKIDTLEITKEDERVLLEWAIRFGSGAVQVMGGLFYRYRYGGVKTNEESNDMIQVSEDYSGQLKIYIGRPGGLFSEIRPRNNIWWSQDGHCTWMIQFMERILSGEVKAIEV